MREKIILFTLFLFALILGVSLGYQTAQKYRRLTFAHGITYFGPDPASVKNDLAGWKTISGKIFPYKLSYPQNLNLIQFPNDPNDSLGLGGPQKILLYVEKISQPAKDFVSNYWQLYPGLSGIKYLREFTTEQGLTAIEASYSYHNLPGQSLDIFIPIENNEKYLIHLIKGNVEDEIFKTIVSKFILEQSPPAK